MQITTCNSVANSLQVTQTNGDVYCFHRDAAGTGLVEDLNGVGRFDLLTGGPVTLATTTGSCPASGGFCPTLITGPDPNNPPLGTIVVAAAITLRLTSPTAANNQTTTFTTTIAPRN